MAHTGKIHPHAGEVNVAPPSQGSNYNGKEQRLPAPATYHRAGRGRSGCCGFLTCLCSLFTVLVLLLCLVFFIFWLVVHPKAPKFDVENVHISGLKLSSSPVTTNITYAIRARNANKRLGFHYDDINVSVEVYGVTIGEGSIPSFYQGHKNTTFLSETISSEGVTFNSETLALLRINPTIVPLYAEVDIKARAKVGSVTSFKITIKVRCNLNVDLTHTSGSQLTYKFCWAKW